MYKSLLRKNRIPSTALESLKGALSCFNFFSSPMRLSAYLLGVLSPPACPNKGTGFKHFTPNDPPHQILLLPSAERAPRSRLGHGFFFFFFLEDGGLAESGAPEEAASLSNKWVSSTVGAQHGLQEGRGDSRRRYLQKTPTHRCRWVTRRMVAACGATAAVLSGGCVVPLWRGSSSSKWRARP